MPLGCVDITDVEGDGRGEHSSVGVLGVDRDGVLDEGPGGVDVPLETQEPRLVREGLRVGGRQLEDVVVHVDCGVEITFPEQLLRFEQSSRVVTRISPVIVSLSVRLPENWATRIPARVATTAMPASHIQPVRFAVGALIGAGCSPASIARSTRAARVV